MDTGMLRLVMAPVDRKLMRIGRLRARFAVPSTGERKPFADVKSWPISSVCAGTEVDRRRDERRQVPREYALLLAPMMPMMLVFAPVEPADVDARPAAGGHAGDRPADLPWPDAEDRRAASASGSAPLPVLADAVDEVIRRAIADRVVAPPAVPIGVNVTSATAPGHGSVR